MIISFSFTETNIVQLARRFRVGNRQAKANTAAFSNMLINPDSSAVGFDDCFGEVKAKPGAFCVFTGIRRAVKAVKNEG